MTGAQYALFAVCWNLAFHFLCLALYSLHRMHSDQCEILKSLPFFLLPFCSPPPTHHVSLSLTHAEIPACLSLVCVFSLWLQGWLAYNEVCWRERGRKKDGREASGSWLVKPPPPPCGRIHTTFSPLLHTHIHIPPATPTRITQDMHWLIALSRKFIHYLSKAETVWPITARCTSDCTVAIQQIRKCGWKSWVCGQPTQQLCSYKMYTIHLKKLKLAQLFTSGFNLYICYWFSGCFIYI